MDTIFPLFFLITGILAMNPNPPNSGYPQNNNNNPSEPYEPNVSLQNQPNQASGQMPNPVLVNSNSNFAFKFLKQAFNGDWRASSVKKNLVFSPVCISSAFAMLSLGTRANTLDQILKGLSFKPSEIQERMIHKGFHDLIRMFDSDSTGLQVEMGSCLFVENKLHLQPQFMEEVRNIYGGEIFMENFQNTVATERHINSYIERKTHGKISKLIDTIDPITQVLLVSYIYLKGKTVGSILRVQSSLALEQAGWFSLLCILCKDQAVIMGNEEGKHFPLLRGKARAAPMGLPGSK